MAMYNVTITDATSDNRLLAFDLIDILRLLGAKGQSSLWNLSRVESFGEKANVLNILGDQGDTITGSLLIELASGVNQTIDGIFSGYLPEEDTPWIVIQAIEGTAFDVETTSEQVIRRLKSTFKNVNDIPT